MPRLPRPCLDCGRLATDSRCPECSLVRERIRDKQRGPRPHYAGDYRKRAKAVRESPGPCWICGEGDREGDPWQADHVVAGDPQSMLAKSHRSCNIKRGGRGKQTRSGVE